METAILGYFGATLIILSMMQTDMKKLRIVQIVASIVMFIYAATNEDIPYVIVNTILTVLNSWEYYKLMVK